MNDRAVLYDWRKKTYLYGLYPYYNISNGPDKTRELSEISDLTVTDIKLRPGFIAILTEDGSVWTAGKNIDGQLSGVRADSPIFTKVLGLPAVKEIATGSYYCIALTKDDELFSWGSGFQGALGRVPVEQYSNPTPTNFNLGQGASLPATICCTEVACMALTEDAEVFTWGNLYSIGRSGNHEVPGHVQGIPFGETVIKVACGDVHMLALTASGKLYGWGENACGELLQVNKFEKIAAELDLEVNGVHDVVAGARITIIESNTEAVYYFGMYHGQRYYTATRLEGSIYPRDLMAKAVAQDPHGAVSLGCK